MECSPSNPVPRASGEQRVVVVERSPLFSGVPLCDYARICASSRIKEYARGQMLYIEGAPIQQVLLVTSGLVKITKFGQVGTEVIIRLEVPGDVLGALGLFTTGIHYTTAQALRVCHALAWDAATFKSLVEEFPVLRQNMLAISSRYLLELEERFREMATERVASRVARQIMRLLKQIGRPVDGSVEIALSREELAQMTGTTLFTISRLFSAWEARGMVSPRREAVAICDIQSLQDLSEPG